MPLVCDWLIFVPRTKFSSMQFTDMGDTGKTSSGNIFKDGRKTASRTGMFGVFFLARFNLLTCLSATLCSFVVTRTKASPYPRLQAHPNRASRTTQPQMTTTTRAYATTYFPTRRDPPLKHSTRGLHKAPTLPGRHKNRLTSFLPPPGVMPLFTNRLR